MTANDYATIWRPIQRPCSHGRRVSRLIYYCFLVKWMDEGPHDLFQSTMVWTVVWVFM